MKYSACGRFKAVEFNKGWSIVEGLKILNLIKDGI